MPNDCLLPVDTERFASLVRSARTEAQRAALWRRINGEFKARASIDRPGPRPPLAARTPAGRLFERRLLEFVRTPVIIRSINEIDGSQASAWMDLVSLRSRSFATMLRRWMRTGHPRVAAGAARHLAWMGLDADRGHVLGVLRRAAAGKNARATWKLREQMAIGLADAANDDRLSPAYRRAAFEAIKRLFAGPGSAVKAAAAAEAFGELAGALLALDPRRGAAALADAGVLRLNSTAAWAILYHLSSDRDERPEAYRQPIDPAVLWPVYEALRDGRLFLPGTGEDRDHHTRDAMGYILLLAADGDPLRTARECRAVFAGTRNKWDPLQIKAKAALKRIGRIPEPADLLQRYWKATLRPGGELPSPFGPAATKVVEAFALYDHVLGDGLQGYFGNMGWHWRRAVAGLELIGANAAAKLVREAATIVEAFGPLRDAHSALAAKEWDKATYVKLERLGKRFSPLAEGIMPAVERYIARYTREFAKR